MHANSFFDILSGLVLVALATTLVSHKETAGIISSSASGFSTALKAAQGY